MPILYNREEVKASIELEVLASSGFFRNSQEVAWMTKSIMRNFEKEKTYLYAIDLDVEYDLDTTASIAVSNSEPVYSFDSIKIGEDIGNVEDWIVSEKMNHIDKVIKMSWSEAVAASEKWHRSLAKQKRVKAIKEMPVYLNCGEYNWYWLQTPEDKDHEGKAMGNCVGGGAYDSSFIMSLRDDKGVSHVTAEVNSGYVGEVKGHGNSRVADKYQDAVRKLEVRINNDWAVNDAPMFVVDGLSEHSTNEYHCISSRYQGLLHSEDHAVIKTYHVPTRYKFIAGMPDFAPEFTRHYEVWHYGEFQKMILANDIGQTAVIDNEYKIISHDFHDELAAFEISERKRKEAEAKAREESERRQLEAHKAAQKSKLEQMTGAARIMQDPDTPIGTVCQDVTLVDVPDLGRRWIRNDRVADFNRDPEAFSRNVRDRQGLLYTQSVQAVLEHEDRMTYFHLAGRGVGRVRTFEYIAPNKFTHSHSSAVKRMQDKRAKLVMLQGEYESLSSHYNARMLDVETRHPNGQRNMTAEEVNRRQYLAEQQQRYRRRRM